MELESNVSRKCKPFDDIKVSTTTVVVPTNLVINTDLLFHLLPIYELTVPSHLKSKKQMLEYIYSLT
jgi:hypothetical protein